MRRMALVFLLCGVTVAQAQTLAFDPLTEPAQVERALHSVMPLQVAVGAYRAISIRNPHRGEWSFLRGAHQKFGNAAVERRRPAPSAFFSDALIKTHTPVPLVDLLPFFDQFPGAMMGVVARGEPRIDEDRLPLLLKAEERKNSAYWYGAASLMDRKQLIHHLLEVARFDYAISVVDQDFLPDYVTVGTPGGIPGGVLRGNHRRHNLADLRCSGRRRPAIAWRCPVSRRNNLRAALESQRT